MGFAERLADTIRSMHGHLDETSTFEANTRTIIALVIVVVVGAVASASGVGGGAIFVPVLNALVGFDLKSSTALSQACITAGSATSLAVNLLKHHPADPRVGLVDFALAAILTPMLLVGVGAGVLLNVMLPAGLLTILLGVLLLALIVQSVHKGRALWRQETTVMQQLRDHKPPPGQEAAAERDTAVAAGSIKRRRRAAEPNGGGGGWRAAAVHWGPQGGADELRLPLLAGLPERLEPSEQGLEPVGLVAGEERGGEPADIIASVTAPWGAKHTRGGGVPRGAIERNVADSCRTLRRPPPPLPPLHPPRLLLSDELPSAQHDGGWVSNRSPPIAVPGAPPRLPPPPEEAHSAAAVPAGPTAVAGGTVSFSRTSSSSWAAAVAAAVSTTWRGFSELGEVYPPDDDLGVNEHCCDGGAGRTGGGNLIPDGGDESISSNELDIDVNGNEDDKDLADYACEVPKGDGGDGDVNVNVYDIPASSSTPRAPSAASSLSVASCLHEVRVESPPSPSSPRDDAPPPQPPAVPTAPPPAAAATATSLLAATSSTTLGVPEGLASRRHATGHRGRGAVTAYGSRAVKGSFAAVDDRRDEAVVVNLFRCLSWSGGEAAAAVRRLPLLPLAALGLAWGVNFGLQVLRSSQPRCGPAWWGLTAVQTGAMAVLSVAAAWGLGGRRAAVRQQQYEPPPPQAAPQSSIQQQQHQGEGVHGPLTAPLCKQTPGATPWGKHHALYDGTPDVYDPQGDGAGGGGGYGDGGAVTARSDNDVPPDGRSSSSGPHTDSPLDESVGALLLQTPGGLLGGTCAAGLAGGLLGMGGGIVMGPLLLHLGLRPQVTAATSGAMVLFSSSAALVQLALLGRLNGHYAAVYGAASAAASGFGSVVLAAAVARSGRPSLVVLALACVMAAGCACVVGFGLVEAVAGGGAEGGGRGGVAALCG